MGIFGWISRKAQAVTSAISGVVKATGRAISGGYKSFTGQATFEEADRMYNDVLRRFENIKPISKRKLTISVRKLRFR